AE
ncbi:hypothetical protein D046_4961B, partial [Vibrio parahaemolyticus V-223/04]